MDGALIRAYAVTIIQIAQSAKGVSDADLAHRLRLLGVDANGWTVRQQIAEGSVSVELFLQCLVALEIATLETAALVAFVEALSCPTCSPFRPLPPLVVCEPDLTEPIPF